MLGLNKNLQFLKEQGHHDAHNNFVIYYLDQNEFSISQKLFQEIFDTIPEFIENKTKIKNAYEKINNNLSNYFQKTEKKKKNGSQKTQPFKNLTYVPTSDEQENSIQIIKLFKDLLTENIVAKIPPNPKFIENENKVYHFYIDMFFFLYIYTF